MRRLSVLATLTGILGFLLALGSAFLPVRMVDSTLHWDHARQPEGVTAPLVSYLPTEMSVSVSCADAVSAPPRSTLLSTIPVRSAAAGSEGLLVYRSLNGAGHDSLNISSRGVLLLSVPVSTLTTSIEQYPRCQVMAAVHPSSSLKAEGAVTAEIISDDPSLVASTEEHPDGPIHGVLSADTVARPQVVGVFSTLPADSARSLTSTVHIDTRFTSQPTTLKLVLMWVGILVTVLSLVALWMLERGMPRRPQSQGWVKGNPLTDCVVIGVLFVWHFLGANTSDDGYLLNMARVADNAGYISNYFRWLGSPESPIGWYYFLLQHLTGISTASPFIRIPTLLAGILGWLILSHSLLPRLGDAVHGNRTAYWTAGMLYLACWMPLNNGLRPEPIEALLFIVCWALVEHAIATHRVLPGTLAIIAAAFAIGAGPTGVMCGAVLIAGFRQYWSTLRESASTLSTLTHQSRWWSWGSLMGPIMASGFAVLYTVFADQTLASMKEAVRVRTEIGPSLGWFEEKARWIGLLGITPDGAVARRLPIFLMLILLVIISMMLARRRPIAGVHTTILTRVVGISVGSLLLLSLTPTKWTHHFGTFTGVVAMVGAVGAVALTSRGIGVARNRWLTAGALVGTVALAFTANNQWWYVSQFGIPTSSDTQQFPTFLGKSVSTWLLGVTLLCLLMAALLHFFPSLSQRRSVPEENPAGDSSAGQESNARVVAWKQRWMRAWQRYCLWQRTRPLGLTLFSTAAVLFCVVSLVGGVIRQYPAYSVGLANLRALGGHPCSLADDVLVEENPGQWMLTPVDGQSPAATLRGQNTNGFRPGAVPTVVEDKQTEPYTGDAEQTPDRQNHSLPPFGLPANTPVEGTYSEDGQVSAELISGWWRLPERREDSPLIVLTVAGSVTSDSVRIEWTNQPLPGHAPSGEAASGQASSDQTPPAVLPVNGSISPMDPGPQPTWRNLRTRRGYDIPDTATAIRLHIVDTELSADKWTAVTPPRAPRLRTLQEVVGSQDPVLIDWSVGLAFPCQRPYGHRNGIAEQPLWRILPNAINAESANRWQDRFGGGPLGWIDPLYYSETVPTYLSRDWYKDWGALQRFIPRQPGTTEPKITTTEVVRSGTWTPGVMRDTPPAKIRR